MEQLQDRPHRAPDEDIAESTGPNAPRAVPDSADTQHPYTTEQRRLHWIVAALVFAQLALGVIVGVLPRQPVNAALLHDLLLVHLLNGTLIFFLVLRRQGIRRLRGVPAPPAGTPLDAAVLARANHVTFYVLLLILPLLGWITYAAHGRTRALLGATHGALAFALTVSIALHLAGVAYHKYWRHDGLLRRMLD
jgi:cytochrome b561